MPRMTRLSLVAAAPFCGLDWGEAGGISMIKNAVAWLDLFNVLERIGTSVVDRISWEGVTPLWPMRRKG